MASDEHKDKKTRLAGEAQAEEPAITRFREYLRINTMQPTPDYASCTAFLKRQAEEIGLQFRTWEGVPGKPLVIMTWPGTDPARPTIVLNSHTDVVPVFEDQWKYPPFSAHKDENGDIFARGSQDMKCVGMQYLEAIRVFKQRNVQFAPTFHLTFVPDEEIGGHEGMGIFVKTKEFKELNVGFALDEGLASEDDVYPVYYGERVPWWIRVRSKGQPGHGSRFLKDTAAMKLHKVMNRFLNLRDEQEKILEANDDKLLGDVTTVNMTMLKGGVQMNVIPAEMEAGFDVRIAPTVDLAAFKKQVEDWCSEEGVEHDYLQIYMDNPVTDTSSDNKFWMAFKSGCDDLGLKIRPQIFPAATDSRYIRCAGIPAIGFSPMPNTPVLLHDHNEFLNEKTYLRGIEAYLVLLSKVAAV